MVENSIAEPSHSAAMASKAVIKTAKKELRFAMKQRLAKISPLLIHAQSNALFKSITSFKPYLDAKRIGIYLSMPHGEIQTHKIVRHALEAGKQVFVPYLHKHHDPQPDTPRSVMEMVNLRSLDDFHSLKRDSWGIPTIDEATIAEREHVLENATKGSEALDIILMPGVAFDIDPRTGFVRRLGHGKGFYDYFLHRYVQSRGSHVEEPSMSPKTDVLLYGLALEEQFLEVETGPSVPVGEHDSLLHGLVLGDGKLVLGPVKRE